jgi:ABC-2 type transport system permease protein
MKKTLFIMANELRLLGRDRPGLLLLLAMPLILVLTLTLVQENILKGPEPDSIQTVIIAAGDDSFSRRLADRLSDSSFMTPPRVINETTITFEGCQEALDRRSAHYCLFIPQGITAQFQQAVRQAAQRNFKNASENRKINPDAPEIITVQTYIDPAVRGATRAIITGTLSQVLAQIEVEEVLAVLKKLLVQHVGDQMATQMGMPRQMISNVISDDLDIKWDAGQLVRIDTDAALAAGIRPGLPTAAQHNVPAWALFGMFFIVVPLSGTMIRERRSGLFTRLQTLPVTPISTAAGKLLAYAGVCVMQFSMVMLMGRFILPMLGTAPLEMGNSPLAVAIITLVSAVAAASFGVLIGTVAKTQEQAAAIGPVSVVAAAALGGLMVPVFAMPRMMQSISNLSPLGWGHKAYMEVFLRGGSISDVSLQMLLLGFFAVLNLAVAAMVAKRQLTHQ